jgi:hypothetical protein
VNRDVKRWLGLFAILGTVTLGMLCFHKADHQKIRSGMPAKEVFAILGEPSYGEGDSQESFWCWDRPGYRIVVILDHEDRVTRKEIDSRLLRQTGD